MLRPKVLRFLRKSLRNRDLSIIFSYGSLLALLEKHTERLPRLPNDTKEIKAMNQSWKKGLFLAAVCAAMTLYAGASASAYTCSCATYRFGTPASETIYGDATNDCIFGSSGDDILYGANGDDCLFGEDGNDTLYPGGGNDYADGGNGWDSAYGDSGNDELHGWYGNDFLMGQSGSDTLFGEYDNDELWGGNNPTGQFDTLDGGPGSDKCREGESTVNCEL